MIKALQHTDAATVANAVKILSDYGDKAMLMAGGTDLLGMLKTRASAVYPEILINIKTIPGLDYIKKDNDGLKIGALTRLADIVDSPAVRETYPILADAARSVATPQIRNMGTLGGNMAQDTRCWYYRYPHGIGNRIMCRRKGTGKCLAVKGDNRFHAVFNGKQCFAVCPSDMAVALAALDAGIKINGPKGERLVPVINFYHPLGLDLGPGEIITEIHIPKPAAGNRQTFIKHRVRESVDFAIVSVGAVLSMQDKICAGSRIVLGAVAPGPFRATRAEDILSGRPINKETAEAAALASVAGAKPLSRNTYKIEIIKALVKKAVLP